MPPCTQSATRCVAISAPMGVNPTSTAVYWCQQTKGPACLTVAAVQYHQMQCSLTLSQISILTGTFETALNMPPPHPLGTCVMLQFVPIASVRPHIHTPHAHTYRRLPPVAHQCVVLPCLRHPTAGLVSPKHLANMSHWRMGLALQDMVQHMVLTPTSHWTLYTEVAHWTAHAAKRASSSH